MKIVPTIVSMYLPILLVTLLISGFSIVATGQTLSDKLNQKADTLPKSNEPLEQLIEIARQYQIPMGIEWVESANKKPPPYSLSASLRASSTIREVIRLIVGKLSGYKVIFGDASVYVAQEQIIGDSRNFLNFRIPEIRFSESALGNAEGLLRQQIRRTLNPGKYAKGWNGGYGYAPEEGKERKITLGFRNATIREILNGLVAAHGNSTWVVRLVTTKEMQGLKYYEQGPLNSGQRVTNDFYWQLINFSVH